jgi:hypothetical protein
MMRLFLGLGALVLILGAVALGLPAHVTVARSVVINAPEYAIFPYLNSPRRYASWSSRAARDPKISWESENPSIGIGSMEIVNSEQPKSVELTANFNGLDGTGDFDLAPAGSGSKVTWSFGYPTGSSPFKRWKALMVDGFIGAEYEAGLQKLKARVEEDRRPTARPAAVVPPQAVPAPVAGQQGHTVVKQAPAQAAPAAAPAESAAPQRR